MVTKEVKQDIEEFKAALNMMGGELATISEQQRTIKGLVKEIMEIKKLNEEKQKRISLLEIRVSDLEQNTCMNDVIISGLPLRPKSYALALKVGEREDKEHDDSVEAQVTAYLQSKNIQIDRNNIEPCHTIKSQNQKDGSVVIVRFHNRKHKTALLGQSRYSKGTNVYINEHLTKFKIWPGKLG